MHLEGQLAERDINPLMVLPSGQGGKAADALGGEGRQRGFCPDRDLAGAGGAAQLLDAVGLG
jgi:hypothetical protein